MSHFTVLGARGFIGSRLTASLLHEGHQVDAPERDAKLTGHDLGHVIYAMGVTSDFLSRAYDTVTAHVCRLVDLLREGQFASLTYLSSTRVYQGLAGEVDEHCDLRVNTTNPGDLYNLSKLLAESLALAESRDVRIVRLSNVFGPRDPSDNFLPSIIRSALSTGRVTLLSGAATTRDYVSLADVVRLLPRIAIEGRARLYNLASGGNVSHAQLAARLAALTGCQIRYAPKATVSVAPRISTALLRAEFDFAPSAVLDELPALVESYRTSRELAPC